MTPVAVVPLARERLPQHVVPIRVGAVIIAAGFAYADLSALWRIHESRGQGRTTTFMRGRPIRSLLRCCWTEILCRAAASEVNPEFRNGTYG